MNAFNRRDFLKLAGVVFASGAVLPTYPTIENSVRLLADPQIRFGKVLLRGTAHGTIFSSGDEGNTWKQLANFGEDHPVLQFAQTGEQVYANIGLGSYGFWLGSADARRWFTV
jgi:hypothetical protein